MYTEMKIEHNSLIVSYRMNYPNVTLKFEINNLFTSKNNIAQTRKKMYTGNNSLCITLNIVTNIFFDLRCICKFY